jgi:isoquinoline 1-oxidoreductase beta subunit
MKDTPTQSEASFPSCVEAAIRAQAQSQSSGQGTGLRQLSRRDFIRNSALLSGGLVLAFQLAAPTPSHANESEASAPDPETDAFEPNGYLQIRPDGAVILYAMLPEIGQGVKTSMPMVVAEELDVPWESVEVRQSAIDASRYGPQFAGGSMATSTHFDRLRTAGASARHLLIQAAAARWKVPASECGTANARVNHTLSGNSLSYGELANDAATFPIPAPSELRFKARKDYHIIGKRKTGVDNLAIVTGKPLFGYDLNLPDQKTAVFVKCPASQGRLVDANLEAIRSARGVVEVFTLEANSAPELLASGIAIIAGNSWDAIQAMNLVKADWDRSQAASDDSAAWEKSADQAVIASGETRMRTGDPEGTLAQSPTQVEATYHVPFIHHATLEPMNCAAHHEQGRLTVWAPSQTPQEIPALVEKITGIKAANVTVHQMRIGGGFGRRLLNDYVAEAVAIAHRVPYPVKLIWTREQDFAHDFLRVGARHHFRAGLDAQGKLTAWQQHFITFTDGSKNRAPVRGGNFDENTFPLPMIPHRKLEETRLNLGIPCGWWRAPGACSIGWAVQGFLQELSHAAKRDHLEFLLELMGEPRWLQQGNTWALHTGRAADVIRLAAEKGDWGKPMPAGHGRGLAFYFSHQGHVAEVAEVSVEAGQKVKVKRVVVACDVGVIINRSAAENQVEGSVVDGLSSMAAQEITFTNGAINQSNFHDYLLLRLADHPKVETHFIESDFPPTGLGEPALPPLLPAVAHAIFMACGKRIRNLPLTREGLRFS